MERKGIKDKILTLEVQIGVNLFNKYLWFMFLKKKLKLKRKR